MSTSELVRSIEIIDFSIEAFRFKLWKNKYPLIEDEEIILAKNKVVQHWMKQLDQDDPELKKLKLQRLKEHLDQLRAKKISIVVPNTDCGVIDPKCAKAFIEVCSLLIPELEELANSIWDELYDVQSDGKKKTPKKIELAGDLTEMLIALDVFTRGELISKKTSHSRLGRLLEDNFVHENGDPITQGTVKSMFSKWTMSPEQFKTVKNKLESQIKTFPVK
jgi:hypothetical protein